MFLSALNITADDAEALYDILLQVVREYDAELGLKDASLDLRPDQIMALHYEPLPLSARELVPA